VNYKLVYTYRADKDIKRLDTPIKNRIGKTLLRYKEDPFKYAERLTDLSLGTYRFRIGDYRIIFDIEGSNIVILRVGHRKEIYKRK
jgi:mRNA interferase RelE/StbE